MTLAHQQPQKWLTSLTHDPSLTHRTTKLLIANHEYNVIELIPTEQSQKRLIFTRLVLIQDVPNGELLCCQRVGFVKEYDFDGISSTQIQNGHSDIFWRQEYKGQQKLRQALKSIYKENKSLEIIRIDQPSGSDIFVSYCSLIQKWIISNQSETILYPCNDKLLELSSSKLLLLESWHQIIQQNKNQTLLRHSLTNLTICGKISGQNKNVKWHAVTSTIKFESICQDPFDAKQILQKSGLAFTKIKTLSNVSNLDKVVRALENIVSNVRSDVSQNKSKILGRCNILLVSNYDKKVIASYTVLTTEDVLFAAMKFFIASLKSNQEKMKLFQSYLFDLLQGKKFCLPFPSQHYLSLFQKALQVVSHCGIGQVKEKWAQILKFSLYAEAKKIDLQKFGASLLQDKNLLYQIKVFSFEQLSPINCQTIILYNFILPNSNSNSNTKSKLIESLRLKYEQLALHFDEVKVEKQTNFNASYLMPFIESSRSKHKISHFVIDYEASLIQLKSLLKQLKSLKLKTCYFRMITICEQIENETIIGDNFFPFSWQNICYMYSEVYNENIKLNKIDQRCKRLHLLTEYLSSMKNEQFSRWHDKIELHLPGMKRCSTQLKKIIAQILQSETMQLQKYYQLLLQLKKESECPELNYEETSQFIISKSYTEIKSIDMRIK